MTGYRTIAFHLIMGLASFVGLQIAPDTAMHWAGFVVLAWMAGGIILRFVTTTPAFKTAAATSPELTYLANLILAHMPQADLAVTDADPQPAPADAPATGGATITAPPGDLVSLATSITNALTTIQSVHAAMTSSLSAAKDQVSAALPSSPAPQPAPAQGGVNA